MLDHIADGGTLNGVDCQHLTDKIRNTRVFDVFGRLVDAAFDLENNYIVFKILIHLWKAIDQQ